MKENFYRLKKGIFLSLGLMFFTLSTNAQIPVSQVVSGNQYFGFECISVKLVVGFNPNGGRNEIEGPTTLYMSTYVNWRFQSWSRR